MSVIADFSGNILKADGFVGGDGDNVTTKVAAAGAVSDVAVTFTSGSAPTTDGAQTIANSASPTATELLALIYEIRAELKAVKTALA